MKKLILSVMLICIVLLIGTSVLAEDYVFTSEITESQKELTVTLDISPSVKNSFFIINAYTNNKVVAHKLVKADTLTKEIVLKCQQKPDDVRVNIWNNLVNVKPVIDTVKYEKNQNDNILQFTPKDDFPADFSYVEGIVCANEKTSINSDTQMQKDYIKIFSGEDTYTTIYAPGINTDKYLGRNVVAAYETDNGVNNLKNINEDVNNITIIENASYIQPNNSYKYPSDIVIQNNTLCRYLSVYNDEIDYKNTKYELDNANIIYNGVWVPASDWETYLLTQMAKVELINNDDDDKYEIIYVTDYTTYVVDSIYDSNKKIGMKVGSTIDLTNHIEGNEGYTYSITLDGKKINITDLKKYDVLSVAASSNLKNIDILVSRNVVEGSVEAIDYFNDPYKTLYTIAGKEYTIANSNEVTTITLLTEGRFHLDAFGKIAIVSDYPLIRDNLAYIVAMGKYESWGESQGELKLMNEDGSVKAYLLAESLSFTYNGYTDYFYEMDCYYQLEEYYQEIGSRLITYKTNAFGEINKIAVSAPDVSEGLYYQTISETYSKDLNGFNTASLKNDTIVFYAPAELDSYEYEILSPSVFEDGQTYDISLYDINSDSHCSVAVIHSEIPCASPESIATVVKSKAENGTIIITLSQDGEEKEFSLAPDCAYNTPDNNLFTAGTTFRYTLNLKGEIKEIYDENFEFDTITYSPLGFVEAVGYYTSVGKTVFEVLLFNKHGQQIVYNLANKIDVKVNGTRKKIVSGELTDEAGLSYAEDVANYLKSLINENNYAERLISYIEKAGNITTINLSQEGIGEGMQYKAFDETYSEELSGFSSANIIKDAIIFYLPEERVKEEYEITSVSALKDNEKYSVYAFNINSDLCSNLLIVTTTINNEASSSLATVIKSEIKNDSIVITFTQDSEEKTLTLAKNCVYNTPDKNLFTTGTTFKYTLNLSNEIKEIYDENFVFDSINSSIAYIKNVGYNLSMGEERYIIELLNEDGNIVYYNLFHTVSVKTNNGATVVRKADEVADMLYELIRSTNYAGRVISYIAVANEDIVSITLPDSNAGEGLSISPGSERDKYDASTNLLGDYGITDETIIFYIPTYQETDSYRVLNRSHLRDGNRYSTAYLDIDEDYNAGIVVITEIINKNIGMSSLAIVKNSTIVLNEDGDQVTKVTFLQDGEQKILTVDAEAVTNDSYYFPRGSIFEYSANFDECITDAKFCGFEQNRPLSLPSIKNLFYNGQIPITKKGGRSYEYIGGYVVNKSGSILTLSDTFYSDTGNRIRIPDTANIYTMDVTRSKIVPQVASIGDIIKCEYQFDGSNYYADEDANTFVLIKYVNDTIVDVIAYNGFALY